MRFGGFLLFRFQIDNITSFQSIVFMQVVILHQLLPANIKLSAQEAESIAITSHDIRYIIGYIYLMRIGKPRLLLQLFLPFTSFTFAHATTVVLVKVVIFNNRNQTVGIRRVCRISGFLQTASPTFIIRNLQVEQESIAGTTFQEGGMIFVRVAGIAVSTETFIARIIIVPHRASTPVAATLDAEVIVAFAGQRALSGTTFQKSLCQGDAGRYLVFLHLLHGKRSILFYIFHVTGIPALRLDSNGTNKECQNCGKSDSVNSVHSGMS